MRASPPVIRKQPKQSRSKALVAAIVEACRRILESEGEENLTTNRIAEVAGVTIGSLYQYFPNKEAILMNLFSETVIAESEEIARQSIQVVIEKSKISLRATVHELIAVSAKSHLRYLELHGDFYRQYHEAIDFFSPVNSVVADSYKLLPKEEWFPKLLEKYHPEIKADELEQTAFIALETLDHLLSAAVDHDPGWLQDSAYLQKVENIIMNFLPCGDLEKRDPG